MAAGNAVVNDCFSHGKLTQTYTKAELSQALAVMSSYVKQYSNCQIGDRERARHQRHGVKANGTGGGVLDLDGADRVIGSSSCSRSRRSPGC